MFAVPRLAWEVAGIGAAAAARCGGGGGDLLLLFAGDVFALAEVALAAGRVLLRWWWLRT